MLRKTLQRAHKHLEPGGASMRPQRNAAENIIGLTQRPAESDASMRPQRNAAENNPDAKITLDKRKGFNEAAA